MSNFLNFFQFSFPIPAQGGIILELLHGDASKKMKSAMEFIRELMQG